MQAQLASEQFLASKQPGAPLQNVVEENAVA